MLQGLHVQNVLTRLAARPCWSVPSHRPHPGIASDAGSSNVTNWAASARHSLARRRCAAAGGGEQWPHGDIKGTRVPLTRFPQTFLVDPRRPSACPPSKVDRGGVAQDSPTAALSGPLHQARAAVDLFQKLALLPPAVESQSCHSGSLFLGRPPPPRRSAPCRATKPHRASPTS